MKKYSQVKAGIVFSYLLIIINALYGVVITPYIINQLGMDEYGVYKTIGSLTASLIVIDLGIGGTVQRYVAKYIAEKQNEKISNFIAMNLIQAAFMSGVLIVVCLFLFFSIDSVYGESFSINQIETAQIVFFVLSISMIIQFFSDVLNGVIVGYNHFAFGNGIKLAQIIVRIILVYVVLLRWKSAVALALIDLLLIIIVIVIQRIYISFKLKQKIKLTKWENSVFFDAGKYTLLMFITSLVSQINTNADNVIVGALSGPSYVAIYSIGLLFFGMFQSLSGAVAGVMLPTVTNALQKENGLDDVIDIVVRAGRFQFALIGAGIIGFIFLGEDFINVWLGSDYSDAYIITLILVVPSVFELCINVCLSILRAQNKLGFRTIVISISAVLNIIITIIAVKNWCYIGAAIGTAFSYLVCSLIVMNVYYVKVIKLPMILIYKRIVKGIWECLLVAGVVLLFSSMFLYGSYLRIILNVVIFCVVYGVMLLCFGLERKEKEQISVVKNIIKKK